MGTSDPQVPWLTGELQEHFDAFRNNITSFLQEHGTFVCDPAVNISAWVVPLNSARGEVRLHVYAERLDDEAPVTCDQCRIIGWQHHFISNVRYHFVLPALKGPASLESTDYLPSYVEAKLDGVDVGPPPIKTGDHESQSHYNAPATALDYSTHLLHGVIHLNGFGHLLRINGVEGGSVHLTGRQIMAVWDKLCGYLRAREITVEDVSNKSGMELRVLHAVAHKLTWYGMWGYTFGRGDFNISRATWRKAMSFLHSCPLAPILNDVRDRDAVLVHIMERVRGYADGRRLPPDTLGEIVKKMLTLMSSASDAAALMCPSPSVAVETLQPLPQIANGPAVLPSSRPAGRPRKRRRETEVDGGAHQQQDVVSSVVIDTNVMVRPKLMAVTLPGWDAQGYFEPDVEVEDLDNGDYVDVPVVVEEGWQPPVQPAVPAQQAHQAVRSGALPRAGGALNTDAVLQTRIILQKSRRGILFSAADSQNTNVLVMTTYINCWRPAEVGLRIEDLEEFVTAMGSLPKFDLDACKDRWDVKKRGSAIVEAIITILKRYEGMWVPRNVLRADVQKKLQMDAGLLDFLLKSIANTEVNGHYLYRAKPSCNKCLHYRLRDVNPGPDAAPARLYTGSQRLASISPLKPKLGLTSVPAVQDTSRSSPAPVGGCTTLEGTGMPTGTPVEAGEGDVAPPCAPAVPQQEPGAATSISEAPMVGPTQEAAEVEGHKQDEKGAPVEAGEVKRAPPTAPAAPHQEDEAAMCISEAPIAGPSQEDGEIKGDEQDDEGLPVEAGEGEFSSPCAPAAPQQEHGAATSISAPIAGPSQEAREREGHKQDDEGPPVEAGEEECAPPCAPAAPHQEPGASMSMSEAPMAGRGQEAVEKDCPPAAPHQDHLAGLSIAEAPLAEPSQEGREKATAPAAFHQEPGAAVSVSDVPMAGPSPEAREEEGPKLEDEDVAADGPSAVQRQGNGYECSKSPETGLAVLTPSREDEECIPVSDDACLPPDPGLGDPCPGATPLEPLEHESAQGVAQDESALAGPPQGFDSEATGCLDRTSSLMEVGATPSAALTVPPNLPPPDSAAETGPTEHESTQGNAQEESALGGKPQGFDSEATGCLDGTRLMEVGATTSAALAAPPILPPTEFAAETCPTERESTQGIAHHESALAGKPQGFGSEARTGLVEFDATPNAAVAAAPTLPTPELAAEAGPTAGPTYGNHGGVRTSMEASPASPGLRELQSSALQPAGDIACTCAGGCTCPQATSGGTSTFGDAPFGSWQNVMPPYEAVDCQSPLLGTLPGPHTRENGTHGAGSTCSPCLTSRSSLDFFRANPAVSHVVSPRAPQDAIASLIALVQTPSKLASSLLLPAPLPEGHCAAQLPPLSSVLSPTLAMTSRLAPQPGVAEMPLVATEGSQVPGASLGPVQHPLAEEAARDDFQTAEQVLPRGGPYAVAEDRQWEGLERLQAGRAITPGDAPGGKDGKTAAVQPQPSQATEGLTCQEACGVQDGHGGDKPKPLDDQCLQECGTTSFPNGGGGEPGLSGGQHLHDAWAGSFRDSEGLREGDAGATQTPPSDEPGPMVCQAGVPEDDKEAPPTACAGHAGQEEAGSGGGDPHLQPTEGSVATDGCDTLQTAHPGPGSLAAADLHCGNDTAELSGEVGVRPQAEQLTCDTGMVDIPAAAALVGAADLGPSDDMEVDMGCPPSIPVKEVEPSSGGRKRKYSSPLQDTSLGARTAEEVPSQGVEMRDCEMAGACDVTGPSQAAAMEAPLPSSPTGRRIRLPEGQTTSERCGIRGHAESESGSLGSGSPTARTTSMPMATGEGNALAVATSAAQVNPSVRGRRTPTSPHLLSEATRGGDTGSPVVRTESAGQGSGPGGTGGLNGSISSSDAGELAWRSSPSGSAGCKGLRSSRRGVPVPHPANAKPEPGLTGVLHLGPGDHFAVGQWGSKGSRSRLNGPRQAAASPPGPRESPLPLREGPGGSLSPPAEHRSLQQASLGIKKTPMKRHTVSPQKAMRDPEEILPDMMQVGWKRDHRRGGGLLAVYAHKSSPEALAVVGVPIADLPRVDKDRRPSPSLLNDTATEGKRGIAIFEAPIVLPDGAKRARIAIAPADADSPSHTSPNGVTKKPRTLHTRQPAAVLCIPSVIAESDDSHMAQNKIANLSEFKPAKASERQGGAVPLLESVHRVAPMSEQVKTEGVGRKGRHATNRESPPTQSAVKTRQQGVEPREGSSAEGGASGSAGDEVAERPNSAGGSALAAGHPSNGNAGARDHGRDSLNLAGTLPVTMEHTAAGPGRQDPVGNGGDVSAGTMQGEEPQETGKQGSKKKRPADFPAGCSGTAKPVLQPAPVVVSREGSPSKAKLKLAWQRLTPGGEFKPQVGVTPRDQVLCDMIYMFNKLMRDPSCPGPDTPLQDGPLALFQYVQPKKAVVRLAMPQVRDVMAMSQLLRDVKHFVKDYQGELLLPTQPRKTQGSGKMGKLFIMCQVELPVQSPPPKGRREAHPERARVPPPPELVVLHETATIAELKVAAARAFQQLYRAFMSFEVDEVEGLPGGQSHILGAVPPNTLVTVRGHGIDFNQAWRHAGGVEDWIVNCRCGTRDDDGERMLECDICKEWSHTRCSGYPDNVPPPGAFSCPNCSQPCAKRSKKAAA